MALPNIGFNNNFRNPNVAPVKPKRLLANESKNMDVVLGSNISKDYSRVDSALKKVANQIVYSPDGNVVRKSETMPSKIDQPYNLDKRSLGDQRPNSQERGFREYSPVNQYDKGKAPSMNSLENKEDRVEGLERMVNYLMDQINNFEKMIYNESKRNKSYFETDKERISKLEMALRLSEDNFNVYNNELSNKLTLLENRLVREEKVKQELRDKLVQSEETQRELMNYIKSIQRQENQEFLQMREILQEKLTEDQATALKERERAKTLFHEVVRLGEQQERSAEMVQNLNLALETKLQAFEAKYIVAERALSTLTQKGEVGLNNLTEWNDKMEKKVLAVESNLYALTREQLKDKETISKLEGINAKLSDDLSLLLNNLHTDYNQRLEAKVVELVNRIVMEHEERIKAHDDFKNQVDLRDQLNQERANYEREEMREKYQTMDALVRAEFQRKDEAIRAIHNIIETQVRQLQAAIKQEEIHRGQFENLMKGDLLRFQENFKKEFEIFRDEQTTTTEKLTEMIKIEIDTRLTSDIELKNHTNALVQNLQQDLETLRDHMERQNIQFAKDLKEVSTESAERANQLSRYIDQEVTSLNEQFSKKYEKLKVLFAKFGEQFKNHLLNTEAFRKETMLKVQEIEQSIDLIKEEVHVVLSNYEKKIDQRMREEREYFETVLENNNRTLEDKMNKVKELLDSDVEILKEAIDNNRSIFMNKLEQVKELIETYHKNNSANLMKVLGDIETIKKSVFGLKTELDNLAQTFEADVLSLRSMIEIELLNERSLRANMVQDIYDKLNIKINDINSVVGLLKIADARIEKELENIQKIYDDRFHKFADQISDAFVKITVVDENLEKFQEKAKEDNLALVARMTSDHLLLESDTKLLFEELKKLVVVVSKENTKTNSFNEKITDYIVNLSAEATQLRKRVEEDFVGMIESKIMSVLERVKKDNQEQWEQTLKHVNTDFKDVNNYVSEPSPQDKLNELAAYQDQYNKPTMKDDDNNPIKKEDLTSKLIEQHRSLKKENHDLKETIEKIKVSAASDLNIEKEQHKKSLMDLAKMRRENKDLKHEIETLKTKVTLKDREMEDLQTRLDKKEAMDNRLKERDLNVFHKSFGKNPTDAYDNKVLSVVKVYESQKVKLEEENRGLRAELEELREKYKGQETEKTTLKREYSQVNEKFTKDYLNKVTELETDNQNLQKDNEQLRSYIEKLTNDIKAMRDENLEVIKKYHDLRMRYNASNPDGVTPNKSDSKSNYNDHTPPSDTVRFNNTASGSKKHFHDTKSTTSPSVAEENFASFKPYAELHELNLVECRRILSEILEMYCIKSPSQIIPSMKKTEKVMQAVPRLQGMVSEIAAVVLPRAGYSSDAPQIELLGPIIKQWADELNELEGLIAVREKICEIAQVDKNVDNLELIRRVKLLSEGYHQFQESKNKGLTQRDNNADKQIIEQFTKMFGVKPDPTIFKSLIAQLEDIKHFINLVRTKANLAVDTRNEAVLTYVIKMVEGQADTNSKATELVNHIQQLLNCKPEEIAQKVEELLSPTPDPYGLRQY